ncbi:hypothetical protein ACFSUK_30150 [Sphingobium scionense]|uniref:Extradiol dioxygenase family protein n=1 Tax=Sphingobium scionense TaxID=1404341 RepID=A0A7W6PX75_9SPHN|nr:hypothetical protein [Sphingobium scionense]MBB4149984.1 extradiol dioxygenase family protein [Sphingobium scionense]
MLLRRPSPLVDPASGVLRAEHFQIAYATNDIDRAQAILADRYGIGAFRRLEGPLAAGGQIRVELAWVGPVMYELLTASGPGSAIYMDRLAPGDAFQMRHHHLGYLIHDDAQWQALLARAEADGLPVPHVSHNIGFMHSCFVDAPELGHYLEYIFPTQAGIDFFAAVPAT